MQRLFSREGPWPTPWMERTLPNIAAIAERFPERTIFTRFIPPQTEEALPGQWQRYYRRWRNVTGENLEPAMLDLVPQLAPLSPPAAIFDKPVYSPFFDRGFAAMLQKREADALIMTGAETDVCVLATVMGAVDHGFRVVLVKDAVCSSSDAGHDALMTLYGERFSEQIDVVETETLLAEWG